MNRIASTAIVYPGVEFGDNVTVEDFCIIGAPFKGQKNEKTIIGSNAIIRSHTVVYAGNLIGENFQTGNKANIRELNQIGHNVSIGTLSVIEHHVIIEDRVRIHTQVFVPEFSHLKEDAWIGPNVVLTNAKYPVSPGVKDSLRGPVIHKKAIIGANSTILPGIIIEERALIGAGSVVTKNVGRGSVVFGNPAALFKTIADLPY